MELQTRRVAGVLQPETTSDGAGVKLKRSIPSRVLKKANQATEAQSHGENTDEK
jgi:hypothetical protein